MAVEVFRSDLNEPVSRSGLLKFVLVTLFAAFSVYYLRRFFHDDAFISLRYARNLIKGHGLVWNPGETPVEGYTNFLWVMMSAVLHAAGLSLIAATRVLGVGSLIGLFAVVLWMAPRASAFPTALLLVTNISLAAWAWGGLETCGFSLFMITGVLILQSLENRWSPTRCLAAGFFLSLAQLCRPEAVLVLLVWIAQTLVFPNLSESGVRKRTISLVAAPFVVVVGSHMVWRFIYYGDWLPNSYYAKSSGFVPEFTQQGLHYLLQFALFDFLAVSLFVLAVARAIRHRDRAEVLTSGTVLGYFFYMLWSGGDHMPWFRFLVPAVPLIYLSVTRFVFAHWHARRVLPWAIVVATCVWHLTSGVIWAQSGWKYEDAAAWHGTIVGLHIHENWPDESVVALNTAGATAFFARVHCIDMLGINDHHIARTTARHDPRLPWTALAGHRKGDGNYVLGRKPDYIIIGGSEGYAFPWFNGDAEILDNPDFHTHYEVRQVVLSEGSAGGWFPFTYYERRK